MTFFLTDLSRAVAAVACNWSGVGDCRRLLQAEGVAGLALARATGVKNDDKVF
jgi:hypothetical protein